MMVTRKQTASLYRENKHHRFTFARGRKSRQGTINTRKQGTNLAGKTSERIGFADKKTTERVIL